MTDIYKKLYGYEDDIQLKDDDIKLLETGTILRKMKKEEFNDRFYRLDLTNNQLIASTKEFRKKEKIYPLISLNEVKIGCSSDDLKHYKLKKGITDMKKAEDMENLAFVVTYDNYRNRLDLMATNQVDRDRWVRVLGYFILLCKKRKGVLPETDTIMRNYFELADKSDNKKLSKEEISSFIDTINFKLKKKALKTLMKSCDMDGDGELDEQEFKIFMLNLAKRDEIVSLFKLITTSGNPPNFLPEFMSVQAFQRFLKCYQSENKTETECREIIEEYEPSELTEDEEPRFSLYGFINYLNDPAQHIQNTEHYHDVYQPMNFSFSNYYINSSHNTYLSGDQVTSTTSAECYKTALMMGARLVELDCYDGSDGQPRIYHQRTLTNKILFEDAIKTIKEYAFKKSDYPVILTLELHCGPTQQRIMAEIIKSHLKEHLYHHVLNPDNYPSLEELKHTILIRCQKPRIPNPKSDELLRPIIKKTVSNLSSMSGSTTDAFLEQNDYEYISEDEDEDFEQMVELSDLVNCIQSAPFKGIDYSYIYYKANDVCSISEQKCNKLISDENTAKIIEYTRNFTTKIYPAYFRQDSSNMNPLNIWLYGFQIAALNFQTDDIWMHLNQALFADNGGCGYVLKPDILRNPDIKFDPLDTITMPNKKKLEIKIISAQNLPRKKHELVKDISDPFVSVYIYGVQADCTHQKTKSIKDNGLNPIWNEDMAFFINCPELAFVKFVVKDQDFGKDDHIGHFTIRLRNMRTGYRHIKLVNKQQKGTLFVGIKIRHVSSLAQLMTQNS